MIKGLTDGRYSFKAMARQQPPIQKVRHSRLETMLHALTRYTTLFNAFFTFLSRLMTPPV